MKKLLIVICALAACPAWAQNLQYLSGDGAAFSYEKNQHGAVLTSVEPFEEMEQSFQFEVGDVLYLGRVCDAFSTDHGKGTWIATYGGFIVKFDGLRVTFPGQLIDLVPQERCRR
jgi:hypothetical protein